MYKPPAFVYVLGGQRLCTLSKGSLTICANRNFPDRSLSQWLCTTYQLMMSKGCVNHRLRVELPALRRQQGYFITNDSQLISFLVQSCRYSDSLRAEQSGDLIPAAERDFLHPSTPALGPIQPPVQYVPGPFHGDKAAGAWR